MSDWKKLRQLAEAATPGPWRDTNGNGAASVVSEHPDYACQIYLNVRTCEIKDTVDRWQADARFIAAASPTTILALLDENDSLRAELAATRRELERWRHSEQIEGDYVCPAGQLLEQRDEVIRDRDKLRAEVERLRAAIETSQLVKGHDALVAQLSAALAAKEEACEIAMAGIIDPDDRERIIALRSIGKDGGNG